MRTTVLLVRHGETEMNVAGTLRGRLDIPLTVRGVEQAEAVGGRIAAEYQVSAIFASPLRRAQQTAEAISERCGVRVVTDERFVDIDYGRWAGRPVQEMTAKDTRAYLRWLQDPSIPLPGAEDPRAVEERAMAALEEIARWGAQCAVVVSHDAVIQLALQQVFGLPLRSYRGIGQHTGTLNELRWEGRGWAVQLLDSAWHLEASAAGLAFADR